MGVGGRLDILFLDEEGDLIGKGGRSLSTKRAEILGVCIIMITGGEGTSTGIYVLVEYKRKK